MCWCLARCHQLLHTLAMEERGERRQVHERFGGWLTKTLSAHTSRFPRPPPTFGTAPVVASLVHFLVMAEKDQTWSMLPARPPLVPVATMKRSFAASPGAGFKGAREPGTQSETTPST